VARLRAAVAVLALAAGVVFDVAGVDLTERRCGERREHGRVVGDLLGHTLAADQARSDDLVCVTFVAFGAGGADGFTAVAARLVDDAVGQVGGVAFG
jgi:hypothetical protein